MPQDTDVYLQGAWVDNVPTAAGTIVTPTYLVTVTDGVLTLELKGIQTYVGTQPTDGFAFIEGLTISPRQALPLQFDFGPAGMPVAAGYDEADNNQRPDNELERWRFAITPLQIGQK